MRGQDQRLLWDDDRAQTPVTRPISRILLDQRALPPKVMLGAMAEAARYDQPLSRVLTAEGLTSPEGVLAAQADQYGAMILRAQISPPEERAMAALPATFCLEYGVLPWCYHGDTLVLATATPEAFADVEAALPQEVGPVMMALTLEAEIHATIANRHGAALARAAETMRPAQDSCRDLAHGSRKSRVLGATMLAVFALLLLTEPLVLFGSALALAVCSLLAAQALKVLAVLASIRDQKAARPKTTLPPRPPTVSILVPLYKERDIARDLVARLSRLSYPKPLLDVVLVLEAEDEQTKSALDGARLPHWIRRVEVPPGEPMTKPRAMNYALGFTRGDIVGIFDAEDAPAFDQIERVVARFDASAPDLACLQGILDFYNPRANWLSRCFAIEYASWFRVMLPGLARLGLAVPLGGTTVFFRREALIAVGGWDAHNVTEDADLGMLLARRGFRTGLIRTVTQEEANNRIWPWIKQRSRWLKGYAITWWVHSRRPVALWRDLGAWRFFGLQMLFLTTLAQFILAPILWSFWLIVFGLPHPANALLGPQEKTLLICIFLTAEAIGLVTATVALMRSPHRKLMIWVPTLLAYFPLGTFAIYKALWEIVRNPFYWDKTEHGHSAPDDNTGSG